MSIIKIQQQDKDGNIIYQETDASIVKVNNGYLDTELESVRLEGFPIIEATGINTYIGSTDRIKELKKGTKFTLFIENDSTSSCSLNLNSYGVKNIKDCLGNVINDLKANIPYNVCYNGSDFILQGKGGGSDSGSGTATAADILVGKTASTDAGAVTGNMPNKGATNATLAINGSYTIPEGYHNGQGKVTQSVTTQGGSTTTPGTADKTIVAANKYVTGNIIVKGDANLIASNIISGKSIFGVAGSASIASTQLKKGSISKGTSCTKENSVWGVTISSSFAPKIIIITNNDTAELFVILNATTKTYSSPTFGSNSPVGIVYKSDITNQKIETIVSSSGVRFALHSDPNASVPSGYTPTTAHQINYWLIA